MVHKLEQVLITGTSSGIGQKLAEKLTSKGYLVFGIARRKSIGAFQSLQIDLSESGCWKKIAAKLKKIKFIPKVVVFNAAIQLNDLTPEFDPKITSKIFETNFFSILEGVKTLIPFISPKAHFIVISSSSAFKGSNREGIGYAASKAAITLAFESLYHHFKGKFLFSTVFFGPVNTNMRKGRKSTPLMLSTTQAADKIIEVIENKKVQTFHPLSIFLIVKTIKLLPANLHFKIFSWLESAF